jgi:hypothetical protein
MGQEEDLMVQVVVLRDKDVGAVEQEAVIEAPGVA